MYENDIINDVKNETEPFKKKVLMLRLEFARRFADLSTSQKIDFFKELKIENSMSDWLGDSMLFAITSSLAFPWDTSEDVLGFFEFLFKINYKGKISKKNAIRRRSQTSEENLDFLIKAMELALKEKSSYVWVSFIFNTFSDEQLSMLPKEVLMTPKIINLINLRKSMSEFNVES